jgi:hypothetical protein
MFENLKTAPPLKGDPDAAHELLPAALHFLDWDVEKRGCLFSGFVLQMKFSRVRRWATVQ